MKITEPDVVPCPKCGLVSKYSDLIWEIGDGDLFYMMCPECEAMTADFNDADLALQAWNRGDVM